MSISLCIHVYTSLSLAVSLSLSLYICICVYIYIYTHKYRWREPKGTLNKGAHPWVGSTDPFPITIWRKTKVVLVKVVC